MSGYSTVLFTCGSLKNAREISAMLVGERLAACANILPAESFYRWEGKVENASEHVVLLKVRTDDFPLIKDAILSMHEYDLPCIVRYDIAEGSEPYLDWVRDSTKRE